MGRAGNYFYGDEEETGSTGVHGKAVLVEYEEVGRIAELREPSGESHWREPLEREKRVYQLVCILNERLPADAPRGAPCGKAGKKCNISCKKTV